ncbi:MAG: double zinc ribbon domain-containing protein [Lachnospiraceae bacterium]
MLFPRRCPICQEMIAKPGALICSDCISCVHFVREPRCKKCGKQLRNKMQEYCGDCKKMPKSFQAGVVLAVYGGPVKESLARVKYHNMRQDLDWFCFEAGRRYEGQIQRWKIQALVPVPIHASRRRKRGYNQAEEICRRLTKYWGIPTYPQALKRIKRTVAQKELNSQQRLKNLEEAFAFGKLPSDIEAVLLVDDIYTTGSTMEACTRALLKKGVRQVYCLSLAAGQQ